MTTVLSRLRHKTPTPSGLLRDNRGAAAVTIAFALTGLIGMAGLATEGSNWYLTSRRMQSAADATAFSAAVALSASDTWTNAQKEGKAVAASAGYNFPDGSNNVTVTLHNPPTSGNYTTDNDAVEAIISQPQTPMLSSLFLTSGPTIAARAVARGRVSSGCVLALNRSNVVDLGLNGNTTLNLNSCAVYVNSDDPSGALTMNGNVTINSSGVYVTGGISQGNGTINDNGNTNTNSPPINDPYANVSVPSYSPGSCITPPSSGTVSNLTGVTVLCSLTITGQNSLTLSPGIYIIAGGSFSMGGQSTLSGSGVTLILSHDGNNNYTQASISGGSTINLTAPTTGSTAGIALMQDRNAPQCTGTSCNQLVGGSTQNITGAIYFPSQAIKFTGNSSTGGSTCTQVIGYELDLSLIHI